MNRLIALVKQKYIAAKQLVAEEKKKWQDAVAEARADAASEQWVVPGLSGGATGSGGGSPASAGSS